MHYSALLSEVGFVLICSVNVGYGEWSDWGQWSGCSVTCGEGARRRYRDCVNPPRGKWCPGNPRETEPCAAEFECPVDGGWSEWTPWSSCSVTCGQGERRRHRVCNKPEPRFGGKKCPGDTQETEPCKNMNSCPRDGGWSGWSGWTPCSVTCGIGVRQRTRLCNNPPPAADGKPCPGSDNHVKECNQAPCPVNGQWSEWSDWTACSATCGSGQKQRRRSCDNPPAQNGGKPCDDTEAGHLETEACNATIAYCPVDGSWSEWSDWGPCETSDCHVDRNMAFSMRRRSCNSPLPKHGGSMCIGSFLDAGICGHPTNCKVDGNWSEWSEWTCTSSLAKRTRTCDNPPPTNGGKACPPDGVTEFFSRGENGYRDVCDEGDYDDYDYEEDYQENTE